MRFPKVARLAAASALATVTLGLAGPLQAASAAPLPLDWTADVDSTVAGLVNTTVEFPQGSFVGNVDLDAGTLQGDIDLPAGTMEFNALGLIPTLVEVQVVPLGDVTGTVDLSTLDVTADLQFDIVLTDFQLAGIPMLDAAQECRTVSPIDVSLTGELDPSLLSETMSGTYTIPQFAGCGFFEAFINLFTAGPNNTISGTFAQPTA
jgi:hypothetical protein